MLKACCTIIHCFARPQPAGAASVQRIQLLRRTLHLHCTTHRWQLHRAAIAPSSRRHRCGWLAATHGRALAVMMMMMMMMVMMRGVRWKCVATDTLAPPRPQPQLRWPRRRTPLQLHPPVAIVFAAENFSHKHIPLAAAHNRHATLLAAWFTLCLTEQLHPAARTLRIQWTRAMQPPPPCTLATLL
jgi:hypothetical protein